MAVSGTDTFEQQYSFWSADEVPIAVAGGHGVCRPTMTM